jgi:hypothetical protein
MLILSLQAWTILTDTDGLMRKPKSGNKKKKATRTRVPRPVENPGWLREDPDGTLPSLRQARGRVYCRLRI